MCTWKPIIWRLLILTMYCSNVSDCCCNIFIMISITFQHWKYHNIKYVFYIAVYWKIKCKNEKMIWNAQDTNLINYVPKANVDHTIHSHGAPPHPGHIQLCSRLIIQLISGFTRVCRPAMLQLGFKPTTLVHVLAMNQARLQAPKVTLPPWGGLRMTVHNTYIN